MSNDKTQDASLTLSTTGNILLSVPDSTPPLPNATIIYTIARLIADKNERFLKLVAEESITLFFNDIEKGDITHV